MKNEQAPRPALWPFFIGDLALLGLGFYFVWREPGAMDAWQMAVAFLAVATGAAVSLYPFAAQQQARIRLLESQQLTTAVAQIQNLEKIQKKIEEAAGPWGRLQEQAEKMAAQAKTLGDEMNGRTREFMDFLQKADHTEKKHLRLEVEKLRRAEAEWLQALVHIFDHIFALHQAAVRSNNMNLAGQIDQFQQSCRMAGRRVGVACFAPAPGEKFESELHQWHQGGGSPPEGARIGGILATGYSYQGQVVRRALVSLDNAGNGGGHALADSAPAPPTDAPRDAAPEAGPVRPAAGEGELFS